jgi:hypothetical protein
VKQEDCVVEISNYDEVRADCIKYKTPSSVINTASTEIFPTEITDAIANNEKFVLPIDLAEKLVERYELGKEISIKRNKLQKISMKKWIVFSKKSKRRR